MCVLACLHGNIHFDGEADVSRKCDLCGGDPVCVRFCPSGALDFVEVQEAVDLRRATLDVRLRSALRLEREEK
jgi:Fe-S-cluster-containing hydrogenase component 2